MCAGFDRSVGRRLAQDHASHLQNPQIFLSGYFLIEPVKEAPFELMQNLQSAASYYCSHVASYIGSINVAGDFVVVDVHRRARIKCLICDHAGQHVAVVQACILRACETYTIYSCIRLVEANRIGQACT